jgi:threonine/homoserine/homoserine lactone efflux protein
VFSIIKYLGVAYLLFLAWKMWRAPIEIRAGELPNAQSPIRLFLTGLALTLGNPKIMMFYLALLPSIIDLDSVTAIGLTELVLVAIAVLAIVDVAWALAAASARRWLKSPRAMRIANRGSATAMGGAAVLIATR